MAKGVRRIQIQVNHEKHEKHESNTENEEIIKDKSADDRVKRKHPLTHGFDFFRVFDFFRAFRVFRGKKDFSVFC